MTSIWHQLLYLHGHALAADVHWRADAPPARGHGRPAAKPVPPMLRWRAVLRAALIG